jgi:hypothetical protein
MQQVDYISLSHINGDDRSVVFTYKLRPGQVFGFVRENKDSLFAYNDYVLIIPCVVNEMKEGIALWSAEAHSAQQAQALVAELTWND